VEGQGAYSPPAKFGGMVVQSLGETGMKYLALFMVCLGVFALIWASARTQRDRSRRDPKR
jgi:hypothetical protein